MESGGVREQRSRGDRVKRKIRMRSIRVYMDVCCLNRPFDDQSEDRIKMESEAVLMILNRCLDEK